jgi:predicted alpha/beta hydrolase family esterase
MFVINKLVFIPYIRNKDQFKRRDVQMATTKKVYIVHGYGATPEDHWFGWLEEMLTTEQVEVERIRFPAPMTPHLTDWLNTLAATVPAPDEHTYFVTHSLGGITVLRYLLALDAMQATVPNATAPLKIGGIVLVSGFADLPVDMPADFPDMTSFYRAPLDYEALRSLIPQRSVIAAQDDWVVPFAYSAELANSLQCALIALAHGGHFLGDEGFTTFPLVYETIAAQLQLNAKTQA